MLMFLSRLSTILTQENKDWRENTVFLFDNAAYHRSKEVREHLCKLGVNSMFTGQYAFESSPIELFFAYFK